MKPFLALICTALLIFWYRTTNIQFEETEVTLEPKYYPFDLFDYLISKHPFITCTFQLEEADYPFDMAMVTF